MNYRRRWCRSLALSATMAVAGLLLVSGCDAQGSGTRNAAGTDGHTHRIDDEVAQELDSQLGELVEDHLIPSAVILVTEGGETVWQGEFHSTSAAAALAESTSGDAEPPADSESRFAYRSITKSFVSTAILMLSDQDELHLDDPVSQYVDGVPNGDEITIEQLASMRSGLPNYTALESFATAFGDDPLRAWTTDELLGLAFAEEQGFAPGTQFQYSNTNTLLLGEILESVTGTPWAQAVDDMITEPLGLASVAYPEDGNIAAPAARPYRIKGTLVQEYPVVPYTMFGAAGGLVGTVDDLAAWADELGSGTLLQPETQQSRLGSFGPVSDDADSPQYDGYGIGIGEVADWVGHTGSGLGFQSLAMHDPATDRSVAILVNGTGADQDLPAHLFIKLASLLSQ